MRLASTCFSILCFYFLVAAEARANATPVSNSRCFLMQLKSCCQGKTLNPDNGKKENGRTSTPSPFYAISARSADFLIPEFLTGFQQRKSTSFRHYAYFIFTGLSPPQSLFKS